MKIEIKTGVCEGYGQCRFNAPAVFDTDDDGTVVVLIAEPDESMHADVEAAADACPVQAITLVH